MQNLRVAAAIALLSCIAAGPSRATDNELTPEERAAGWQLLFNGKDYAGWKCNNDKPVASPVEDGCLIPYKAGGYLVIHEKQFGDFILKCDVKMPQSCNSGVFVRVGVPRDAVQTGFEMQVATGKGTGTHDFGAMYDLAKPAKNNASPPGEWTSVTITCKGPVISVAVNGMTVTTMNCDEYTTPGKNPDGTKNKFKLAVKDFPRKGYIGFQDHDTKVWYKNIRILELPAAAK